MNIERLVSMANDIASFFASEPDPQVAAVQVEIHLRRFWEPRMRLEICRHARNGGTGLSPLARSGIELLAEWQQ